MYVWYTVTCVFSGNFSFSNTCIWCTREAGCDFDETTIQAENNGFLAGQDATGGWPQFPHFLEKVLSNPLPTPTPKGKRKPKKLWLTTWCVELHHNSVNSLPPGSNNPFLDGSLFSVRHLKMCGKIRNAGNVFCFIFHPTRWVATASSQGSSPENDRGNVTSGWC